MLYLLLLYHLLIYSSHSSAVKFYNFVDYVAVATYEDTHMKANKRDNVMFHLFAEVGVRDSVFTTLYLIIGRLEIWRKSEELAAEENEWRQ
jgi:hypothetical protein